MNQADQNRQTDDSPKKHQKLILQKTGPGRIQTTGFCRLKQVCYLNDTCAPLLSEFDVINTENRFK